MATKPVQIANAALGMDLLSDETAMPENAMRDIENFDVDEAGLISRRKGARLLASVFCCHSHWGPRHERWTLYADGTTLKRLRAEGSSLQSSTLLTGLSPSLRIRYHEHADEVFFTNGRELGVVSDARWDAFNRKRDAIARESERLKSTWVFPAILPAEDAEALLGKAIEREYSLADLLRRPGITHDTLTQLMQTADRYRPNPAPELIISRETLQSQLGATLADAVIEQVEIATKYAGYIDKQNDEVQRASQYEHLKLPPELDYAQVTALSFEVRQKLDRHRPETLGQASRISGVTPAAISLLLVHLKKNRFRGFTPQGAGDVDAA